MSELLPGTVVDVRHVPLAVEPVDRGQVLAGSPSSGLVELAELAGVSVGVWEMTAGTATDVEGDEVFVVVAGEATIDIAAADGVAPARLSVTAGDIVRLRAGMRTVWTVPALLRKVYLAPA